jgi:hypothetical protein
MMEHPTKGGALLQVDSSGWPEVAAKKISRRYITRMSLFGDAHSMDNLFYSKNTRQLYKPNALFAVDFIKMYIET